MRGALLALLVAAAGCRIAVGTRCAPTRAFAPWDAAAPRPSPAAAALEQGHAISGLADALVAVYQRHLRDPMLPAQGCRLTPSCSVFARRALGRWNLFGAVLVIDRLIVREHAFMDTDYVPVCTPRRELLDDPVP